MASTQNTKRPRMNRLAIFAVTMMVVSSFPVLPTLAAGQYMTLDVYSGAPGSKVTVTGFAFDPSDTGHVDFQGVSQNMTVDAGGGFTAPAFTVPVRPGGLYDITATMASGKTAVAKFYIQGLFPAATPTEWWVLPGAKVGIIGSNYSPGETVNILAGNSPTVLGTATADAGGNIQAQNVFTAPVSSAGKTITINVVGQSSNASASFPLQIGSFFPHAAPSSFYGTPGQVIDVTGGGFVPGETVDLFFLTTKVTSFPADAQGNINAIGPIQLGFSQSSLTYSVVGETGNGTVSFTIAVGALYPSAVPVSYFSLPGSSNGLIGAGFYPGESVQLQDAANAVIATGTADAKGNVTTLNAAITVPYGAKGNLTYRLYGLTSKASASAGFSVGGFDPQLDPSSWFVAPRKSMSAQGRGYAPGEAVDIAIDGTVISTVTADAQGNFTANFKAPAKPLPNKTGFDLTGTGKSSGGVVTRPIGIDMGCVVDE